MLQFHFFFLNLVLVRDASLRVRVRWDEVLVCIFLRTQT
jgi:hypothetical protein